LFPEGSLVNPSVRQASAKELPTTVTSGLRCLESFLRSGRGGSLGRTWLASILGAEAWFSNKCALTWKMQATKFNRSVFLLRPSTLPTAGIDGGSSPETSAPDAKDDLPLMLHTPRANDGVKGGATARDKRNGLHANMAQLRGAFPLLLPTPMASDGTVSEVVSPDDTYYRTKGGTIRKVTRHGVDGTAGLPRTIQHIPLMLPTPTAANAEGGDANTGTQVRDGRFVRVSESTGQVFGAKLNCAIHELRQVLPTPTSRDHKGPRKLETTVSKGRNPQTNDLESSLLHGLGIGWKLQPSFVEWMMGYPQGWTDVEMPSSANTASSRSATPSSRRSRKSSSAVSKKQTR
jgi:hypothetical protein